MWVPERIKEQISPRLHSIDCNYTGILRGRIVLGLDR